jgi:hypothetical protein
VEETPKIGPRQLTALFELYPLDLSIRTMGNTGTSLTVIILRRDDKEAAPRIPKMELMLPEKENPRVDRFHLSIISVLRRGHHDSRTRRWPNTGQLGDVSTVAKKAT